MAVYTEGKLVTVFGGSGFVGRHVVRALAKRGWRVRVAVRRPDLTNFLLPQGVVGQIHSIQANLRYQESIVRAVEGVDSVVNLVGILSERGAQRFSEVQHIGSERIAKACLNAGISNLVQVSAIGANSNSESIYARTKSLGEQSVLKSVPDAIVIRPSIIFGSDDSFFNKFGEMMRLSPCLPLIGGGVTKFQPVFVGDVAEAICRSLERQVDPGTVLELGGPEIRTFKECLEVLLQVTNRRRVLIPIPFGVAKIMGHVLRFAPGSPLTADQVKLLENDNIVSNSANEEGRTLEGIGIAPQSLSTILPTYLWRFRPHGQFEQNKPA